MMTTPEIQAIQDQIEQLQKDLLAEKKQLPPEIVSDYTLKTKDGGSILLSELFRGKDDLIVIHNMGKSCPYCTLWADGFKGFTDHLTDRAGFVLVSPDDPATLKEFSESRGWEYPVASADGSTFISDMGFQKMYEGKLSWWPGVSTFRKRTDGKIERIATAEFGPGDFFCSIWHLFDLLKDGQNDWSPKYTYKAAVTA